MAMDDSGSSCSIDVEDVFGPVVDGSCLGGFDFTLLFEESILTLLPLAITVIWASSRIYYLRYEPTRIRHSSVLAIKMLFFSVFIILQITILEVWIASRLPATRLTLICLTSTMASYIILLILSYLEHLRSHRPSTVLSVGLGVTALLDIARLRTLFAMSSCETAAKIFLASFCVKLLIFCLEIKGKCHILLPKYQNEAPEATCGVIGRALFIWLNETFVRGFRSTLTVTSLPQLDKEILDASSPFKLESDWSRADKSKKNALLWMFLLHYKWAFFSGVVPRLAHTGFVFSQPFLIHRVLDYTKHTDIPNSEQTAHGLLAGYALVYIGIAVSYAVYQHKSYRLLTLFRGSLVSMIFKKTVQMESSILADAEAVTLVSADIDRISFSLPLIHELYSSVIELGLCLWFLHQYLGVALAAPVLWIVGCLVIGVPLGTAAGRSQEPWLEAIEERLAATAKALGSMKPMKMMGLEELVSSTLTSLRDSEVAASYRCRILRIIMFVVYFASSSLAPVWGFGVYVFISRAKNSKTLTEGLVFATLSLFRLLNEPLVHSIYGFEHIQTVMTAFQRIQDYMASREWEASTRGPDEDTFAQSNCRKSDGITLHDQGHHYADDAKFAIYAEHVSAGYTTDNTLLNNISFTVPHNQLSIVHGPVGSGKSTLLKLILGEIPVVYGSLSKSYWRAAYCPQSAWITCSSVKDNIVGEADWDKHWYDTVIDACALSTDLMALEEGDNTSAGVRGSRLSGGQQMRVSLARAIYSRAHMIILDDVLTGLDRATQQHILDEVFGPKGLLKRSNLTVVWATTTAKHLHYADNVVVLDQKGRATSCDPQNFMAPNVEESAKLLSHSATCDSNMRESTSHGLDHQKEPEADADRHSGDMTLYSYYAGIAGPLTMAIYLVACASYVFCSSFPSIWLQWWVKSNEDHPNERIGYWLGVYAALAVGTMVGCAAAESIFNLVALPRTSKTFHELLLNVTMRAQIFFLTSKDTGSTLNRFGQDLQLIDNDLPLAIDRTVFQILAAVVSAVLVFISSGYVAAAIPACLLLLFAIQYVYLRTSRQMRLLDLEAKAPLFQHLLETIDGITSIRAYQWTQSYIERSIKVLNESQKPYYMLWCIQRWLTLVLDLFNAGVAILLVAVAVYVRTGSTGFLGVALYNVASFGATIQTLITQWTRMETALGSVSRVRSYVSSVSDENLPAECRPVPDDWPSRGAVRFENISAFYDPSASPVLKDIDFSIPAGAKVAICGRSGSGKSSLLASLLRLLDTTSGSISIDNICINTVPRCEVRRRINTLPQEPFFLHGSLRKNLDPGGDASDAKIKHALQAVKLWEVFDSPGGLDEPVYPEKLSHGQRQMFCLARAVVKGGNILILDEAMSSVDVETETLMQEVIRKEFGNSTIISVAHKLDTIIDYDLVLLLEDGQIVESGNPRDLLTKPHSAFCRLYQGAKG